MASVLALLTPRQAAIAEIFRGLFVNEDGRSEADTDDHDSYIKDFERKRAFEKLRTSTDQTDQRLLKLIKIRNAAQTDHSTESQLLRPPQLEQLIEESPAEYQGRSEVSSALDQTNLSFMQQSRID